jgi:hypothetical protein
MNSLHLEKGNAETLLDDPSVLDPTSKSSVTSRYGIDSKSIFSSSGLNFLMNLSDADRRHAGDGASGRGNALRDAINKAESAGGELGKHGQIGEQLEKIFSGSGTFEQKSNLIAETLSDAGQTPEDNLRAGENIFENEMESLMGKAVDFLSEIAGSIVHSSLLGNKDLASKYDHDVAIANAGHAKLDDRADTPNENLGKEGYTGSVASDDLYLENQGYREEVAKSKDSINDYIPLIKQYAKQYNVPYKMLAANILAESGGHTLARNRNSDGTLDGGLGQVNSSNYRKDGITDAGILIPEAGIKEAASLFHQAYEKAHHDPELTYGYYQSGNYLKHKKDNDYAYKTYIKNNVAKKLNDEKKFSDDDDDSSKPNIARRTSPTVDKTPPQTQNEAKNSGSNTTKHELTNHVIITDPNGNKTKTSQTTSLTPNGFSTTPNPKPIYTYINAKSLQ